MLRTGVRNHCCQCVNDGSEVKILKKTYLAMTYWTARPEGQVRRQTVAK